MLNINNIYNMKDIGERIYQTRTHMGKKYTQDYVAEQCNCIRQTYAKWERGEQLPKMEEFLMLCNTFNCDIGFLFCEYATKHHVAADVEEATGLNEKTLDVLQKATKKSALYCGTVNCILQELLSSQYLVYATTLASLTEACNSLLKDENKHKLSGSVTSSESVLIHGIFANKERETIDFQLSKIVQEIQSNIIVSLLSNPEIITNAKSYKQGFIRQYDEMYKKESGE